MAGILIQKERKAARMGPFDGAGFLSAAFFLPVLLFAMTRGQSENNTAGWTSLLVPGVFALAAVSLLVFIRIELRHPQPLPDIRLLKDRSFGTAMVVPVVFGIGIFGGTYLLPMYRQEGLGYTAFAAGSMFLPVGIIQGIASTCTGWIDRRIGILPLAAGGDPLDPLSARPGHGADLRPVAGVFPHARLPAAARPL